MRAEAERIERLREILGAPPDSVTLGIGDDAAVLEPSAEPLCFSIDTAVEHVHFERAWLDGDELGYRASMAALSDLAAMGARPLGVLSSLVLPAELSSDWLLAIARGQRRACEQVGTAVIGGNLSRGGELSITTTVLGAASLPMRRDGARPDDTLWLAGRVGLARAGLEALRCGTSDDGEAVRAWKAPLAEIASGIEAAKLARAAIDISDGLALDVARMAQASGVACVLRADALVCDDLARAANPLGLTALELALYGGEDYALVVAAPPHTNLAPGFRRIGCCRPLAPEEQRRAQWVWLESASGAVPLEARGFDHFA